MTSFKKRCGDETVMASASLDALASAGGTPVWVDTAALSEASDRWWRFRETVPAALVGHMQQTRVARGLANPHLNVDHLLSRESDRDKLHTQQARRSQ